MTKRFIVVGQFSDKPNRGPLSDPRQRGIALGLNRIFAPQLDHTLPDRLLALVAQLHTQAANKRSE